MPDPLRILVVDDDLDICRATCRLLEQAGYATLPAANGAEALALLHTHQPDMALLDRQLPDMDGLEICRQIKTNPATAELVFVVMISAHQVKSEAQLEALERGADGYIARPVSNRELLARIEVFARITRLTRKLAEQTAARLVLEVELEQRVKDRTAELLAANRNLQASQRAAFSLMEDATRSQKQIARKNEELRQEIARREQVEAALRTSEARYRLLAENGSDVIWLFDVRTQQFTYASPAVMKLRGFTAEEACQQTLADSMTPESAAKVAALLPSRLAAFTAGDDSVRIQTHELDVFHRDGSIVPVEVATTLIADEHRQVTHIQGITRDLTERRRAEAALREREQHFRTLADSGQALVWMSGLDKKCNYFNQPWLDFTGRTLAQALGEGWLGGVHPDDLERCFRIYSEAFDRLERFSMDYRLRQADGTYGWIQENGAPRFGSQCEFLGYIGHCLDITERQQAEAKVRASEERLRSLIASMDDLVFVLNRELVFEPYQQPVRPELLIQPELFVGKRLDEIAYPEPAGSLIRQAAASTLATGDTAAVEYYLDLPQGRAWFDLHVTAFRGADGSTDGVIFVVRNVTAAKQSEAALRESEVRQRAILDNIPDPAWLKDLEGRFLSVNQAWLNHFGRTKEEVIGKTMFDLGPFQSACRMQQEDAAVVGSGQTHRQEEFQVHAQGQLCWFETFKAPLRDLQGTVVGTIGIARNITEHRAAEEQLRASEQRFRSYFALPLVGFAITSPERGWIEVNDRLCDMLGYSREELAGMTWAELTHPDDLAADLQQFNRVLAGELEGYSLDKRFLRKDGTVLWISLAVRCARLGSGAVDYLAAILQDISDRKRNEALLAKYQVLSDQARDIMLFVDPADGSVVEANQAAVSAYGYDRAELLARKLHDLRAKDSPETVHLQLAQAAREGILFEAQHQCRDGRMFPVEVSSRAAQVEGRMLVLSVIRDITTRKQAEAKLQQTTYLLEEAQRTARVGHYVTTLATGHWESSPVLDEIFGIDADFPHDVPGWGRIIHPDDQVAVLEHFTEAATKTGVFRVDYRVIRPCDGELRWVAGYGRVEYGPDGEPLRMVGCIQDVTERKLAQEELRELNQQLEQRVAGRTAALQLEITERRHTEERLRTSEQRHRDLVETVPDWVWEVDAQGVYSFVGPQSRPLLGYEPEELFGQSPFDLMLPEEARRVAELVGPVMAQGRPVVGLENTIRHKDGRLVTVETNGVAIYDASGKLRGYRGLDHDITERKRLEAILQESEEKFRSIVDSAPMAMYFYRLEATGRLILIGANPAADRIVGVAHEELLGKSIEEAFPNLVQTEVPEMYRNVALGKIGAQQFEIPYSDARFTGYYTVHVFRTGPQAIAVSFLDISERQRAERALRESEQNLRSFFDTIDYFFFILDLQGNILRVNRTVVTRLGYSEAELAGRPVLETHPPDRRVEAGCIVAAMLAGTRSYCPVPLMAKDGTLIPVETKVMPGTWQGRPALFGVSKDISELSRSEEKFSRTFHSNPSPMAITSIPEGRFLDINVAFERMTGRSKDQAVGKSPVELGLFAGPTYAAQWEQLMTKPTSFAGQEWGVRGWDGTIRYGLFSGDILPLQAGRVWLTVMNDITERRQAEEQLRKLQSAVEQSPTVVVITDRGGFIEYANPIFEAQTGYTVAEVRGRKPSLLQSGIHSREFYQAMWQTLGAGHIWRGEMCNRRKDGTLFWEIAAIAPIRDHEGNVTHFVATKEDITVRRQAEAELRQAKETADVASRAKGAFLASMSHEIRTPMNAILGFAQLLQRQGDLSSQQRQQLTNISRSGEHLLKVINEILEVARIEAGQVSLRPAPFDLHQMLEDLERMFMFRIQDKHQHFRMERQGELPRGVLGDETKLKQVFINLVGNATKFTPDGGGITVRVRAETEPDDQFLLHVEIEDTGAGISPEDLPRLFRPFFQSESGKKAAEGTGLGLPISQQFVRLMGGVIEVQSQVGVGSCFQFSVRLTLAEDAVQPPPAAVAPTQDSAVVPVSTDAQISELPEGLVAALCEATRRADYDQMLVLVEQIAVQHQALGQRLRRMVERFDYAALQKILGHQ